MHSRTRTWVATVGAIALAILVAACSSGGSTAGGGDGGPAAAGPTIAIASPTDGATVSVPFDVTLESSVPLGQPDTGNHHAHLYFDTGTDAADYDIVYGTTWQVTRPLSPGQHTLTVALANPDHSLAGPTQSITIQVGEGAGGSDGSGGGEGGASAPPVTIPNY